MMRFLTTLGLLVSTPVALALDSAVVFNEVHYHPTNELTQSEWIELKSNQGVDIDISDWTITGGANFTFPANTVLPGNGVLVIAKTPAQIAGAIGPFTGSLSNNSETIRLRHRTGRIMDELSYADSGDWPLAADGLGFTLARKNSQVALGGASAWGASQQPGGTPGNSNFPSASLPTTTSVLPFADSWKYDNSGVTPDSNWNSPAFDDSSWPTSVAPFYFGPINPSTATASTITNAGHWSYARWTGDADSQIASTKTYTHKVDLGASTTTTVNTVVFDAAGTSRTGANWSITNAALTVSTNTNAANATRNPMLSTSGSHKLLQEFYYGSPETSIETITLTGLTSGETYTFTFYNTGWDAREFRRMKVTPSNTGISSVIDSRPYGAKASLLQYTYKAPSTGSLTITLEPLQSASWHMCAFTNEVSPALSPENPVSGVTVQAFSSQATSLTRFAANSTDGSGLDSFANHGISPNNTMWLTNGTSVAPNDPLPADITWLLPSNTTLSALKIWNYNHYDGTEYMNRGVKDVEIFVSPDTSGETFTSAGTYVVPQASGCTSETGSRIALATTQTNVRRVRLVVSTNWGDTANFAGLSEVQFLTPGTLLAANPTTTRFRKDFTLNASASATYSLKLQFGADDGAIFYLNGTEFHRYNLPVAPASITATSTASSTIGNPALSAVLTLPGTAFVPGENTLAVQLHQSSTSSTDAWFAASLSIIETPIPLAETLVFNEVAAATDPSFFIEFKNNSASSVSTASWVILTSSGQTLGLPTATVPAGGLIVFTGLELALTPSDGLRLTLASANGLIHRDSRAITNSHRGLTSSGNWGRPDSPTPGTANVTTVSNAIVINEIFYNGMNGSLEQWIELHNRSASPVDVSGWNFSEGIDYTFPVGTTIPAGGFAVVAWDPAAFTALHPGVTALGPFSGSLSGAGETLSLSDANSNIADNVRYGDGGLWSQWADGGGSSLELRDPDADNSNPAAWDASDESTKTAWQTVTYSGTPAIAAPNSNPTTWNEFIFGMLSTGEVLIDDVSVKDVTQGNVELIQNGSFAGNSNFWRIIGNHSGSIVPDPFSPGNSVVKISASGNTDPMHNQAQTTLKNGASYHTIVATDTYTVSFRAKWLRGSNRLRSHFYANRLPRQTLLTVPATGGTPGAANSRLVANIGPSLSSFGHTPVVPAASAAATVSVKAADPDGIASVLLFRSVNSGSFTSTAMTASNGTYTGTITGQAAGTVVQFYVQATDSLGAVSFFPPEGTASGAFIQWADGRYLETLASGVKPHNLRVITAPAAATAMYRQENLMSNADVPCTIVWNESTVYYRAGAGLKSSEHGRLSIDRVGYNLSFPSDDLFLGVHGGIAADRSGGTGMGQSEILLKKLTNLAGGIAAPEDDIIRLIPSKAPSATGITYDGSGMLGAAILSKTRLKDDFLDGLWEKGSDGMMFKYERIYVLTETIDPVTRVVTVAPTLPENPKVTQTNTGPPGVNVVSLGADKESYRWHWLVENGRDTDDFSGLINVLTAIGQTGGSTAFNTQTAQYLDISPWLRATVPASLFGVQDNYLGKANGQHNVLFYFPPGGKARLFPWDLDFLDQTNATAATLTSAADLTKFIANPVYKRLYWGHMQDILNRSFNTATMSKWATHYSKFGTDMTSMVSVYLTPRAAYAQTQINAAVAATTFNISSPANNASINAASTTLTGAGWVNVEEVRLVGSTEPLAVTWTSDTAFTLSLPLGAGTQTYTIKAYNPQGTEVGSVTRTYTNTSNIIPAAADNLAVTELNYNPASATDLEEFIELTNLSASTLDLSNCHFDETGPGGVAYTFPAGTQLLAGRRLLVVRDRAAYQTAYGNLTNVAPGQWDITSALSNSGETLTLFAANGTLITSLTYDDSLKATDGGGYTLVRVLAATNPDLLAYAWQASSSPAGSPGVTDIALATPAIASTTLPFAAQLTPLSLVTASPITYAKTSGPAWLSVSTSGALSGTPPAGSSGSNLFGINVTADSLTQAVKVELVVNASPLFSSNPINLDATEDAAFTGQLSASDVEVGSVLTFTKVSGPAWLSVSSSGALTGTPLNGDVGPNSFTVSVTDTASATISATLNITVVNTNDAPAFSANPVNLDATGNAAFTGQLLASDVDAGSILTFSKVSGPSWLTVSSTGALTGTPLAANVGLNAFTVSVSDGSATVEAALNLTVASAEPSFTAFLSDNFSPAEQANPLISGPAADPDSDGLSNLLEYAFATDPLQPSKSALPQAILLDVSASRYVGLTYTRIKGASDLTFTPEFSNSPDDPSFTASSSVQVSLVDNLDGTETIVVRDAAAISENTPRFARLRITQN